MDEQRRLNLVIVVLISILIMVGSVVYTIAQRSGALPTGSIAQVQGARVQYRDYELIEYYSPMDEITKAAFLQRVVDPIFSYYDITKYGQIIGFSVSSNPDGDETQPFFVVVGFDTGVTEEFPIQFLNGQVQWWTPRCEQACTFSESFRSEFPEIVAYSESQ